MIWIKPSAFLPKLFVPALCLLGVLYLVIWRFLLFYRQWVDESETVVVSKMMAHGQKLYLEIFDNHGPLTFFGGFILEQLGNFSVPQHRLIILFLQIVLLALLYRTPLIANRYAKAMASIVAGLFFVFYFPDLLGHTNQYDTIGGCILSIAILYYVLPAMYLPSALLTRQIAVGNLLIGSSAFLAVTYWPALFILALVPLRKQYVVQAFLWLLLSIVLNLVFLACVGSLTGYFVDHFYFNLKVLPFYTQNLTVSSAALALYSVFIEHYWALLLVLLYGSLVLAKSGRHWMRVLALVLVIPLFFVRGLNFHAMPGFYIIAVLTGFALAITAEHLKQSGAILTVLIIASLIGCSIYGRSLVFTWRAGAFPLDSPFARLVRLVTNPNDKIIAYSFANTEYLLADRLPASGHFFYLPMQEKYQEHPILGISINACEQIKSYKPKVMFIDQWKVWDLYSWDTYGSCIQQIADTDYVQLPNQPHFIRKDILNGELRKQLQDKGFIQD